MPGTAISAFSSAGGHRPAQGVRGVHGEHRLREPGTDAASGLEQLEDLALVVVHEAVQGERVLADDERGGELGRLAEAERGQGVRRALDGHADTTDLDAPRRRERVRRPCR